MNNKMYRGLWIVIAILMILPFFIPNNYYMDIVIRMAINAILVIGLNLLVGFAGQISLGHAGFVGIGAYATAVLPAHFNIPPFFAIVIGAIVSGLIAALVARPIFKLKGHYLAMATLGLGIIINIIIRNEGDWTGGPDGISIDTLSLWLFELKKDIHWYWAVALLLVFSIWASLNLIASPFGRALRALHGSETAASIVGINVVRYKVSIFVVSAISASVMGSITAHYVGFITPSIADFFHSIELITMVVIGGMASVYGSVVGAVLLTALPQVLSSFEGWETVVHGLILILAMIFMPKGLVPTLASKWANRKQVDKSNKEEV